MTNKPLMTFALTFIAGAILALALRAARHEPYAAPAAAPEAPPATQPADPHAGRTPAQAEAPAEAKPVNTVCAICGMDVDPKLPTALYQGKVIGFACKACPEKFAANPEKYGAVALANRVLE